MSEMLVVRDAQMGKDFPMNHKRAMYLATNFSSRFSIVSNPNSNNPKENIMPAISLPQATKKLENGLHAVTALEVKTTKGNYGSQEEVLCCTDNGDMTRVWVAHNSLKAIEAAEKVGLVKINKDAGNWEVQIGVRFGVMVAGGKILALTVAPTAQPEIFTPAK